MKKLFLTLALIVGAMAANAQYYYTTGSGQNPGGLNTDPEYPSGGGQAAGWTNVGTASNVAPVWTPTQTIPFAFSFNGTAVTQYKVSTSGVLTFDIASAVAAPAYAAVALPSATIPNNSVVISGIAGTGTNDFVTTKTFGSAPNRQHFIQFSSYSIPGNANSYIYMAIMLEETTNKIYIIDQRNAGMTATNTLGLGVQVNSTTAYAVTGGAGVAVQAGADATPVDNFYYEFTYGTQLAYDLAGVSFDSPNPVIGLSAGAQQVKGTLINRGSTTITSFDINYSVNGGAPVTRTVSGVSIASNAKSQFTSSANWTPTTTGTYTIQAWASNLNGTNADLNLSNDTVTRTVTVVAQIVPRTVMYEGYSSSTCGPCVSANVNMKNVFDANPTGNYNFVKFQMNWPGNGDPYYNADCGARRTLYGFNSIPYWRVDGVEFDPRTYTSPMLNTATQAPAYMSMSGNYRVVGRTVSCDIRINPVANFNNPNMKLFVAAAEVLTTGNASTNGETEFHHVVHKLLGNNAGNNVGTLTASTPANFSYSYTFPAGATPEEMNDLMVVAWVQDIATKEVFQSVNATTYLSTSNLTNDANIRIYPNPARENTTIAFSVKGTQDVKITMTNTLGQTVASSSLGKMVEGTYTETFNTENLAAGVYMVTITIDGQSITKKVNVAK